MPRSYDTAKFPVQSVALSTNGSVTCRFVGSDLTVWTWRCKALTAAALGPAIHSPERLDYAVAFSPDARIRGGRRRMAWRCVYFPYPGRQGCCLDFSATNATKQTLMKMAVVAGTISVPSPRWAIPIASGGVDGQFQDLPYPPQRKSARACPPHGRLQLVTRCMEMRSRSKLQKGLRASSGASVLTDPLRIQPLLQPHSPMQSQAPVRRLRVRRSLCAAAPEIPTGSQARLRRAIQRSMRGRPWGR